MKNLAVMTMLQREAYLCKVVQYLILCEVLEHTRLLLVFMLILNLSLHVPIVCIVHYNTQFPLFRLVHLSETNDIWMTEDLQDLGLTKSLLSLLVTHLLNVDLLDDGELAIGLTFNEVSCAEGTRAQGRNLFISFVLLFLHHSMSCLKIKF